MNKLEISNLYNHYSVFAYECFKYLNGRINDINIASTLDIRLENTERYGETNYFTVTLFLWKLIEDIKEDKLIRSIIIIVIAHELAHMDQVIDRVRYGVDPEYNNIIECQADYFSGNYLIFNSTNIKQDLYSDFDISLVEKTLAHLKDQKFTHFEMSNLECNYEAALKSIFKIDITLNDLRSVSRIVLKGISFNNKESNMIIKRNNQYNTNTESFNIFISKFFNTEVAVYMAQYSELLFIEVKQLSRVNPMTKV